jgi:hypothetical protein
MNREHAQRCCDELAAPLLPVRDPPVPAAVAGLDRFGLDRFGPDRFGLDRFRHEAHATRSNCYFK